MNMRVACWTLLVVLVSSLSAACGGSSPGPAAPTPVAISISTSTSAVLVPTPSVTLVPTAAPIPSATAIATATAIPSSSPTATATARPSATATRTLRPTATATLLPASQRLQVFGSVWQTIRDNFLYRDFHGVDWDGIRATYEARALAAPDAPAFYNVIKEMLALLKDANSRYLAPWQAGEEDAARRGGQGFTGIGVITRVAPQHPQEPYLYVVFPNSPAADAGLKMRDHILAINGNSDVDVDKLRGNANEAVQVTVRSPGQAPRELTLRHREVTTPYAPIVHRLEADPRLGYAFIPTYTTEDMPKLLESELGRLLQDGPLKGLVIDVRGDRGGLNVVMAGVLSQFVKGDVGVLYSPVGSDSFNVKPGAHYEPLKALPLAVLIDSNSQGASEFTAMALKAQRQTTLIGSHTPGVIAVNYRFDFRDSSRLWLTLQSFKTPDGPDLYGIGVAPDVTLDVDWTDYSERDDPQILKAVEVLQK
jgi:carboxyl-terminal processing protease